MNYPAASRRSINLKHFFYSQQVAGNKTHNVELKEYISQSGIKTIKYRDYKALLFLNLIVLNRDVFYNMLT